MGKFYYLFILFITFKFNISIAKNYEVKNWFKGYKHESTYEITDTKYLKKAKGFKIKNGGIIKILAPSDMFLSTYTYYTYCNKKGKYQGIFFTDKSLITKYTTNGVLAESKKTCVDDDQIGMPPKTLDPEDVSSTRPKRFTPPPKSIDGDDDDISSLKTYTPPPKSIDGDDETKLSEKSSRRVRYTSKSKSEGMSCENLRQYLGEDLLRFSELQSVTLAQNDSGDGRSVGGSQRWGRKTSVEFQIVSSKGIRGVKPDECAIEAYRNGQPIGKVFKTKISSFRSPNGNLNIKGKESKKFKLADVEDSTPRTNFELSRTNQKCLKLSGKDFQFSSSTPVELYEGTAKGSDNQVWEKMTFQISSIYISENECALIPMRGQDNVSYDLIFKTNIDNLIGPGNKLKLKGLEDITIDEFSRARVADEADEVPYDFDDIDLDEPVQDTTDEDEDEDEDEDPLGISLVSTVNLTAENTSDGVDHAPTVPSTCPSPSFFDIEESFFETCDGSNNYLEKLLSKSLDQSDLIDKPEKVCILAGLKNPLGKVKYNHCTSVKGTKVKRSKPCASKKYTSYIYKVLDEVTSCFSSVNLKELIPLISAESRFYSNVSNSDEASGLMQVTGRLLNDTRVKSEEVLTVNRPDCVKMKEDVIKHPMKGSMNSCQRTAFPDGVKRSTYYAVAQYLRNKRSSQSEFKDFKKYVRPQDFEEVYKNLAMLKHNRGEGAVKTVLAQFLEELQSAFSNRRSKSKVAKKIMKSLKKPISGQDFMRYFSSYYYFSKVPEKKKKIINKYVKINNDYKKLKSKKIQELANLKRYKKGSKRHNLISKKINQIDQKISKLHLTFKKIAGRKCMGRKWKTEKCNTKNWISYIPELIHSLREYEGGTYNLKVACDQLMLEKKAEDFNKKVTCGDSSVSDSIKKLIQKAGGDKPSCTHYELSKIAHETLGDAFPTVREN